MKKEKQVRTYQRKTKSGKVVVVRAHKAQYDAAEDLKKSITKKKGSGLEMESLKNEGAENPFGVEMDDFKEWYAFNDWDSPKREWPVAVRRVDKLLVSGMGKKSYDEFCAKVDESWTARGYRKAMKDLSTLSKPTTVKNNVDNSAKARSAARISDEVTANEGKSYTKEEGAKMLERIKKAGFNMYMQGIFYNGYKFNDLETGETLWMNVSTDKRGRMHFDTMHPDERDEHYNYYEKEREAEKKRDAQRMRERNAKLKMEKQRASRVAKKLPKGSFRTVDENGNEIPGAPKHGTKFKADKIMDKVFSSLDMGAGSTGSLNGIFGVGRAKLYDKRGNVVGVTLDTPNAVAHAMANDSRITHSKGLLGETSRDALKDRFSYTKKDKSLGSNWVKDKDL